MKKEQLQKNEDNKQKTFFDLSLFDEIEDRFLRAYNRWNITNNLFNQGKKDIAKNYANNFSEMDRVMMGMIHARVHKEGRENVLKDLQRGIA